MVTYSWGQTLAVNSEDNTDSSQSLLLVASAIAEDSFGDWLVSWTSDSFFWSLSIADFNSLRKSETEACTCHLGWPQTPFWALSALYRNGFWFGANEMLFKSFDTVCHLCANNVSASLALNRVWSTAVAFKGEKNCVPPWLIGAPPVGGPYLAHNTESTYFVDVPLIRTIRLRTVHQDFTSTTSTSASPTIGVRKSSSVWVVTRVTVFASWAASISWRRSVTATTGSFTLPTDRWSQGLRRIPSPGVCVQITWSVWIPERGPSVAIFTWIRTTFTWLTWTSTGIGIWHCCSEYRTPSQQQWIRD